MQAFSFFFFPFFLTRDSRPTGLRLARPVHGGAMTDYQLTPEEWETLRQLSGGSGRWLLGKEPVRRLIELGLAEERDGHAAISPVGQAALERHMRA
jgi:hypothetical protein